MQAGLYLVIGTRSLKRIAIGALTLGAHDAVAGRVAVRQADSRGRVTIRVYSTAGRLLYKVTPDGLPAYQDDSALGGRYLVALVKNDPPKRWSLVVYDSRTGSRLRTLVVGRLLSAPVPQNLDVEGDIALYTHGYDIHAVNLKTGRDKVVVKTRAEITFARIEEAGVVYTFWRRRTLVHVPFERVATAVS